MMNEITTRNDIYITILVVIVRLRQLLMNVGMSCGDKQCAPGTSRACLPGFRAIEHKLNVAQGADVAAQQGGACVALKLSKSECTFLDGRMALWI
eukprot:scaffold369656_cov28-Prasinocladus_malaysianus.AAC.1